MLVSYYLPGNSLAPPPALRARGHSAHGEEEQSLFDPSPHGWSTGGGAMRIRMLLVILAWFSTRTPAVREGVKK